MVTHCQEGERAGEVVEEEGEEEQEEKKGCPANIQMTEEILKRYGRWRGILYRGCLRRTRHLISSRHFVVRVATLNVMRNALWQVSCKAVYHVQCVL